jgi:hypothetical protein
MCLPLRAHQNLPGRGRHTWADTQVRPYIAVLICFFRIIETADQSSPISTGV